MVSQLCTRTGSAHWPRDAAAFRGADAPVAIPPPVALEMMLPFRQRAMRPPLHVVFSVLWNSQPLI